ncbi:MAG TPA: type II toxin-antitoxin system Phd/YefM family antitoxin [Ktedonobacterales bacterium]|nr:type II toxin-antitoxin system Phd/YefM family antitoxin [Ktedonobacterales bacterium]
MVTKRMSAKEARENFSDVLGIVFYGKEPIIVERKGKPMAVLISPEQYERYEQQVMERLGQVVDELRQHNANADPEELQRDIDEALTEVRRERHEREPTP